MSIVAGAIPVGKAQQVRETRLMTTDLSDDSFQYNPLDAIAEKEQYRRSMIQGVLESYNGNYDFLSEALQNAVDALEDAKLSDLRGPFRLIVTVNLKDNWVGVLDTGVGMDPQQVLCAFAPSVSFKDRQEILRKRGKANAYRGYKGVGLTFLGYATDEVRLHSKRDGQYRKARMQYGRTWAYAEADAPALVVSDKDPSPLDNFERGTYIQVQFSSNTRPRSLTRLCSDPEVWKVILRTRTSLGQLLLSGQPLVEIQADLDVVDANGAVHSFHIEPEFLYPHSVTRKPPFRFLDLMDYYKKNKEVATPPAEILRQDGLYLFWDTAKITAQLSQDHAEQHKSEIGRYSPQLYAFIPYQGSVWGEINGCVTGAKNRKYLYPGLMIAINRQRLADIFDISATRYETFSRNVLVVVHFDDAKPDQGRKTVQEEILSLARRAADRAVQYLAMQRPLLKPAGESPSPGQREVEKSHGDWIFNVKYHAQNSPLQIKPTTYLSTPQTEQDVVGLFHQLSALGTFPGIQVFATSQNHTYDCLVKYECESSRYGLRYGSSDTNPLGVSPYVCGAKSQFETKELTLEFKNNLDALISDVTSDDSGKAFAHIDICVCWSTVDESFEGFEIEEITEANLDMREFPGATHLLRRDGETHIIQVILLETVAKMINSGRLHLASLQIPDSEG